MGRKPDRTQKAGEPVNPQRPGGAVNRRTAWQFESVLEDVSVDKHFGQLRDLFDVLLDRSSLQVDVDLRLMVIASETGNLEFPGTSILEPLASCDGTLSIDVYAD